MNGSAPAIYAPTDLDRRVEPVVRMAAGLVGLGCLALLVTSAWLQPAGGGIGTHEQFLLPECQFLQRTGLPCPSCGMTTSFAWFVRGNLLAAVYVQPMGAVLAALAAAGVWIGFYVAATGRSAMKLLRPLPTGAIVTGLILFGGAAWAWKIFLHLRGIDGW